MKFAFLGHPLSQETRDLLKIDDPHQSLRRKWGRDVLGLSKNLHQALGKLREASNVEDPPQVRMVDHMTGLTSPTGDATEGRIYEIPLDAWQILQDPSHAMRYMEEAVDMAVKWGADVVGLGALTGVIGGQGVHLAERGPVAITTGDSLEVYAAVQNVHRVALETDTNLAEQTVTVVGVPACIATAIARMLKPHCGKLILVGKRRSNRALSIAEQLDAEYTNDLPAALAESRLVIAATSTGNCIEQEWLIPGSIVIDVAVPTDVIGFQMRRDDVLIVTGGLTPLPQTMSLQSNYLWFHHGVVPGCLAETMLLALEKRAECFSLGRKLEEQKINEIGRIAQTHGIDFSRLFSFGLPLPESDLVRFRQAARRRAQAPGAMSPDTGESSHDTPPPISKLAQRAASLYERYMNPVLMAMGKSSGFVKTFVRGDGIHLWDEDDNKYQDFACGAGAVSLGHNHSRVVQAVQSAMSQQTPGFTREAVNPYAASLAEKLITLAPPGLEMVHFTDSSHDSVKAALKLARLATDRIGLLCCENAYHGEILDPQSVHASTRAGRIYGAVRGDADAVPFGNLASLDRVLSSRHFAAFIVEPVQSEYGFAVPPEGYLKAASELCKKYGTLFIADESQVGLGRLGHLFAMDAEDVQPDLLIVAKSLGGGLLPIGAMLARREHWMQAYGTAHTYQLNTNRFGNGSLACAAGLATLSVLDDPALLSESRLCAEILADRFNELCENSTMIKSVSGKGLMVGVEFHPMPKLIAAHWKAVDTGGTNQYLVPEHDEIIDSFPATYIMQNLLQAYGIYTQSCRANPHVVRFQPPLIVNPKQINGLADAVKSILSELEVWFNRMDGLFLSSNLGKTNKSRGATR